MVGKRFFWLGVTAVALLALAAGVLQATEAYQQGPAPAQAATTGAVPAKISYQGMLTDGGSPVNGSRNLIFKLFTTTNCSGTALQTITKNNVAVQDGLFNVVLDVDPAHFNGQALRLRVEIGATALGCEEVLPAPYALFSASTGSLHGRPVSAAAPAANQVLKWNGTAWAPAADADTTYTAGTGLILTGTQFSANLAGSGSATTIARSDHGHFAANWSGANASAGFTIQNTGAGDGMRAFGTTSTSNNWAALYAVNNGTSPGIYATGGGTYAAYFPKPIFVGTLVTSATLLVAQNDGAAPLQVGELVAVSGLTDPLLGTSTPVIQVTRVDTSNAPATIGVVQSRGVLEMSEKEGQRFESVNMAPGAAEAGEYVFVVVQGLAQVKVAAGSGEIQAGDVLVVGQGGAIHALAAEPPRLEIGRALESADPETGLAWVLIGIR
jgi:hypothetical protein